MKVKELLADPKRWTKGAMARRSDNFPVSPKDPSATCWCLMGAIEMCYLDPWEAKDLVIANVGAITTFNDQGTHEEILSLCERLDL